MRLGDCLFSLRSPLCTLHSLSLIFHFILLIFDFYLLFFHVRVFGARSPVHFAHWGVWPFGQQRPSHRLWAQLLRWFPLLRNRWNFPPEPSSDTRPSYLHDAEISDDTIGRALSSPLFTQERKFKHQRKPESRLRKWANQDSPWTTKRGFTNTSSKLIMIEEVSRNWMELSSLNEVRLIVLMQETNNFDEINNFFMNNYWNKIGNFVKLIWKVSMRWKNCSDFKGLRSMNFREEDLSRIETLSLNSQPRFRN